MNTLSTINQTKKPIKKEEIYHVNNQERVYERIIFPIEQKDDQVVLFGSIANDITEKTMYEEKIRKETFEREAILKEAHHMAKLGRWDLYHLENRLQWTETIFGIFEIDSERFGASYEAFLSAIHPDDRAAVDEAWKRSLVDQKPYDIEHRLLMDDGRVKWVLEQCRTEFDQAGHPIHSIGIVQDITDRKEMEHQLFKEKEQFKTTLISVGDGVISTDSKGKVQLLNPVAEELTGWSQEEAYHFL